MFYSYEKGNAFELSNGKKINLSNKLRKKSENLKLISKFNNTKDLLIEMKNKNLVDIPVVEPKFEIINGEAKLVG